MKGLMSTVFAVTCLLWGTGLAGAQESKRDKMDPLSKMFLLPTADQFATPSELNLNGEPIEFRNGEGHQLRGWYIRTENAEQTIMICPGNAANISVYLQFARIFADGGFNVLLFDYQGYGKSEGIPSCLSLTGDVTAAYTFLTEEKSIEPKKIGVFGISLGSVFAIHLAARHPVGALAVEDTFIPDEKLKAFVARRKPNAIVDFLLKTLRDGPLQEVDPIQNAQQISCPIFFLHGQLDHFLPPFGSCRVCSSSSSQKRIWIMKDVGHSPDSVEANDREFAHQLQSFFADAFAGRVGVNEPKVTWHVKQKTEAAANDPPEFETTIEVSVEPRAAIEIALINDNSQSVVLRRMCDAETIVTASTRFKPTFVSAIKCRYVLDDTQETWEPDLSQLSRDREVFNKIERTFFKLRPYHSANVGNKNKEMAIGLWKKMEPLLPEPDTVHPHVRPCYADLVANVVSYMPEVDDDQLLPVFEHVLKYLPNNPSKHYRLGNAWFDLGFEDSSVGKLLLRWARIELDRGDIKKAHELLRLHANVSRPELTPVSDAMIPDIKTVERFDEVFGARDKKRK